MMLKTLSLVFLIIGSLSMTACGFTLRGTSAPLQIQESHARVSIHLPDDATSHALKQPLIEEFELIGVTSDTNANQSIEIKNLRFRRYELVGTLTEIRLVLTADVTFADKDGQKSSGSLQVEQSYQYNEASVASQDRQGEQVRPWLYHELAKRIVQKYHALALPSKK